MYPKIIYAVIEPFGIGWRAGTRLEYNRGQWEFPTEWIEMDQYKAQTPEVIFATIGAAEEAANKRAHFLATCGGKPKVREL